MIKGKIAQDQLEKQIFWVTFRSLLVIPIFLVNFLMFIGAVISFFVGGIIVVTIIWIIINIIVFTVIFTSARKTQNQLLVFNGIHKETKKELGEANILILLAWLPAPKLACIKGCATLTKKGANKIISKILFFIIGVF